MQFPDDFVNKIIHGDCKDIMALMPENSVDMIFTSPPYADQRKNVYGGIAEDKYVAWFTDIAKQFYRILKPSGSFFVNIKPHAKNGERALYVYELVCSLKKEINFRFVDEFCWTKNGVPGRYRGRFKNSFEPVYHFAKAKGYTHNPYAVATEAKSTSISRYKRKACGESKNGSGLAGMRKEIKSKLALPGNHLHIPQRVNQHTIERLHPAVFPVALPEFFIKAFSNSGDVILDPFAGSSTTAIACMNTEREYICIDKEEKYVELSMRRINNCKV